MLLKESLHSQMAEKLPSRNKRLYQCILNQGCVQVLFIYKYSHEQENRRMCSCKISVSVYKITQNVAVHLPENQSVFVIENFDLSHIFGCDSEQNQAGVIMRGKRPH